MILTKIEIDFEKFLKLIGGLKNGFNKNNDLIYSRHYFSISNGWLPMIQNLILKLIDTGWNREVCQVKEKFGGLRFYINDGNKEIFSIIREYENMSYHICELCGKKGELRTDIGWYRTLCEKHYNHKLYKLKIEKNIYERKN